MSSYSKLLSWPPGCRSKFITIIKLIILLFIINLKVSATTYGQYVTFEKSNVKIKDIFREIKHQTGYDVLWEQNNFDANRSITARFNRAPLSAVLRQCIINQKSKFIIEDNSIVIKPVNSNLSITSSSSKQDSLIYKGQVFDENGNPLAGATVRDKETKHSTFTTQSGEFAINISKKGTLIISYIGYQDREITLLGVNVDHPLKISMIVGSNNLGEVNIVSTGYQDIPKERATGSFEVITKEQLQHTTDPNLLRRLEGITTSMNFNNRLRSTVPTGGGDAQRNSILNNLTIRGRNTLETQIENTSGRVLVVIDGIPSPYPIENINPNDVENITILKDAAAASIWGSKAANGVIVVKTKKGSYQKPLNVSFNSNINITEKVDPFYKKIMSTSDYVDTQVLSYNQTYDPSDPSAYLSDAPVGIIQFINTPVFEIMNDRKSGKITQEEAERQLNILRGNDVRRDFAKYIYRSSIRQSYSLGIDGGSKNISYRLSAGYDNVINNIINSDNDRLTFNYVTSFKPFKSLDLSAGVSYAISNTSDPTNGITGNLNNTFFLYTSLADKQGNPLSIPKTFRPETIRLLESNYGNNILNMDYIPLVDVNEGYDKTKNQNLNLSLSASYKVNNVFSANITYNYNRGFDDRIINIGKNSFYMRERINYYTDPSTFSRALQYGDYYNPQNTKSTNQTLRGQLNVNKHWSERHSISAIAGIDIGQNYSFNRSDIYYGYDPDRLTFQAIPPGVEVPILYHELFYPETDILPETSINFTNYKVRNVSVYSNAAYTFSNKYTISGSMRRDGSSELGVGSNSSKGGTPFYSMGLSWNLNNEKFYRWDLIPRLQLRATFGYNGNVSPLISSNNLIFYGGVRDDIGGGIRSGSLLFSNVTNRSLRPERTGVLNLGLDFGFKNNRISGSIEYYDKQTKDLLTRAPIDPSSGFASLTYNVGNIHGWGTDLNLNSINIRSPYFTWNSNFLLSYNRVKLTEIYTNKAETAFQFVAGSPVYNKGYDLQRLFAFRWAGLDPNTGDPRGYINGKIVTITDTGENTWNALLNSSGTSESTHYMGSSVPVYYGSLRNTFSYKNLSVSINLLYKLGYYFRRATRLSYVDLFQNRNPQPSEYARRWQKPGDEMFTNVPSLTFPLSSARDNFYANSDINVLKGDHVRLQEVNFSYLINKKKWFIKNPRVFANVSNLGVIWRANKLGIDPDIQDYPAPRNYTFGFSADF